MKTEQAYFTVTHVSKAYLKVEIDEILLFRCFSLFLSEFEPEPPLMTFASIFLLLVLIGGFLVKVGN